MELQASHTLRAGDSDFMRGYLGLERQHPSSLAELIAILEGEKKNQKNKLVCRLVSHENIAVVYVVIYAVITVYTVLF